MNGQVNGISVTIDAGRIGDKRCDACVIPQRRVNTYPGDISKDIIESGGKEGFESYEDRLKEVGGQLPIGGVCATPSGGGKPKVYIHAAIIGTDREDEFAAIQKGTFNALMFAFNNGIKTITIPDLGANTPFNGEETARAIFSAIYEFAKQGGRMQNIRIAAGDDSAKEEFMEALDSKKYTDIDLNPVQGQNHFRFGEWASEARKNPGLSRML